jgi:hypothetical protein
MKIKNMVNQGLNRIPLDFRALSRRKTQHSARSFQVR